MASTTTRKTTVGTIVALALVASACASTFDVIIEDSVLIVTGGTTLFNADFTKLKWHNVTVRDTTVEITNAVSVEITDSTFENVALKINTISALSGNATFDVGRVFKFASNSFTYTGTTTHYQLLPWTAFVDFHLQGYAAHNPAPADFTLAGNDVAVAECGPRAARQIRDRSEAPPIITTALLCNDFGLRVDCSTETQALVMAELTERNIDRCTNTTTTVAYGIQQMNNGIYGFPHVVSGSFATNDAVVQGADVTVCTTPCNAFCVDNCVTLQSTLETQIGRYMHVTQSVFDPQTGLVTIEVEVEQYHDDAVIITMDSAFTTVTDAYTSGLCSSREHPTLANPLSWSVVHSDFANRFNDAGLRWARTGTRTVSRFVQPIPVVVFQGTFTFQELAACSGVGAGPYPGTLSFKIRSLHSSYILAPGNPVHVTGVNERLFTAYFFSNIIAVVQQLNTISDRPLVLYPKAPYVAANQIHFPAEACVLTGGEDVALRYDPQVVTTTTAVGTGPACTVASGVNPLACSTTFQWTIQPTCKNVTSGPTLSPYTHCCQDIEAISNLEYNDVQVPINLLFKLYDAQGTGTIVEPEHPVTVTLQWERDQPFVIGTSAGTSIRTAVYALRGQIHPLQNNSALETNTFVVGQEMIFHNMITGLNFSAIKWNELGLEITEFVQCSHRNQAITRTPFDPNNPATTGCYQFIPGTEQRFDEIISAHNLDCQVPTLTTGHRHVCFPDSGIRWHSNQHILGRCEASKDLCRTVEGDHLPLDISGAIATGCPTTTPYTPANVCRQGRSPNYDRSNAEIPDLNAAWTEKFCQSLANPTQIVSCQASNTVCLEPARCSRDVTQVLTRYIAQLHVYGDDVTPAPITTNFQGLIYVAKITPGTLLRRLLEVGGPSTREGRELLHFQGPDGTLIFKQKVVGSQTITTRCPPGLVPCSVSSTCETKSKCDALKAVSGGNAIGQESDEENVDVEAGEARADGSSSDDDSDDDGALEGGKATLKPSKSSSGSDSNKDNNKDGAKHDGIDGHENGGSSKANKAKARNQRLRRRHYKTRSSMSRRYHHPNLDSPTSMQQHQLQRNSSPGAVSAAGVGMALRAAIDISAAPTTAHADPIAEVIAQHAGPIASVIAVVAIVAVAASVFTFKRRQTRSSGGSPPSSPYH